VYCVFEVELLTDPSPHDADGYERYRAAVPELIARFGGRCRRARGSGTALEGRPTTARWHLVEFPDAESAQQFWSCPEYVALKPLRAGAADVRAVLVEPPPG